MSDTIEDILNRQKEPKDHEVDEDNDFEDEAKRLTKEMEIAINEVKESEFYAGVRKQIRTCEELEHRFSRMLGGSHSHIQIVVYALGSMEFSFASQNQMAIIICIAREFPNWFQPEIQVYDPAFSPADRIVLKNLGCNVLSFNEQCSRIVERPTLFYMPYAFNWLISNVLAANWCPSRINQVVILTNAMKSRTDGSKHSLTFARDYCYYLERMQYLGAIDEYIKPVEIEEAFGIDFNAFAWNFFEIKPDINMYDQLLPVEPSQKKRLELFEEFVKKKTSDYLHDKRCGEMFFMRMFEDNPSCKKNRLKEDSKSCYYWPYRMTGDLRHPRKFRCKTGTPHPEGWIKMNFSAGELSHGFLFGFGVVIYNDKKEIMKKMSGYLNGGDEIKANLKALKSALKWLKSSFCSTASSQVNKLIIEGENLRVIRWINSNGVAPKRYKKILEEVLILMKNFRCVVYHIYEEANSSAMRAYIPTAAQQP
ncbi:hypothetical protein ACFE04_000136 [Oxalis oulophora]